MTGKTVTRADLCEAVYQKVGLSRTESATLVECFDRHTNTCPLAQACGLKGVLADAFAAFLAVLDRYSIADMLARPQWASMVMTLKPQTVSISRMEANRC